MKPNDLEAHFMPFTAQRNFKRKPRLLSGAKGMYYFSDDGRKLIDAASGIWCCNAGHGHPRVVEAIQKQAAELDFAPSFSYSHPLAFKAASMLCAEMPGDIDHVFFSNSGSEAVDTALKIAVAYQRARGKATKTRFISRERAYHGVGLGGISVGGLYYNRQAFNSMLMPGVDHLPHTHNLEKQAFSNGMPEWGAHLADDLERRLLINGADTIAAVIIEPVAGSTGVLPPPKGYLQKIRAICDKHDILLIFDEVITAWGRLGKATASEYFGVMPDIITSAKAITSAAVPMGATFVRKGIYDAFMQGGEFGVEFMHGYTFSAHPLACAAAIGALTAYKEDGMFENAAKMEKKWGEALHSLRNAPHVIDIRNIGLMGAVELDPGKRKAPEEMSRAMETFDKLFFDENIVARFTGNVIAMAPPLIVNESQIDEIVSGLRKVLSTVK